jgi:hypothetical protein
MGFFSQECIDCGHSVLSPYSTNEINKWMSEAVSISKDSKHVHIGTYDGYGRIDEAEDAIGDSQTVWHRACWEVAGRPFDYRGPSPRAKDQGYFFDDGDHDMPDPRI